MGDIRIERQLALEEEAVNLGIEQYRRLRRESNLDETPPGIRLLERCMTAFIPALHAFKADTSKKTARLLSARKFLLQFPDEVIAYITAKTCVNTLGKEEPLQAVAIRVSTMLKDHLEYMNYKEQHPNHLAVVEKNLKTDNPHYRKVVIMRAKRLLGVADVMWSPEERLNIGMKCIELFIESTGVLRKVRKTGDTLMWYLTPVEEVETWIENAHEKCELLHPFYMPMIMPPKKWESCFGGGFITNDVTSKIKLIRTHNSQALLDANDLDMPEVYSAINSLQATAWRINRKIYDALKEVWESGGVLGNVPDREDEPLPAPFWDTDEEFKKLKAEDKARIKEWKTQRKLTYERRISTRSKRFSLIQKLNIAERFLDEPEIFFCWNVDWRGRMYPLQTYINPQGDDIGKALIEFSKGLPLGETGGYWLMVQLANCYGHDKVGFDERVEWVKEHNDLILDSAKNPLDGLRFWCGADDPYRFLAACFEYKGYCTEGNSFVSHLPIGLDGSCNGLQNFSAMLLDEVGGAAVNLIPSDTPQDIYGIIAKSVSEQVEADAAQGNENAKVWIGKIDRKMAKRNVMTYPYGAKQYGFKEQLAEELSKREVNYLNVKDVFMPVTYLAAKMYETIGNTVIAAKNAMKWLQEVSRVVSKAGRPIVWTTPVGYRPQQMYIKQELVQISTYWGDVRLRLGLLKDTGKLNKAKMTNAIAPNFVHSLDASHLMLTVNKCTKHGIKDFAMIHDSYGTHAANTGKLARLLRETFIEQYSQDVLANFKKEVTEQLPEELAKLLPELPEKGCLDLEGVKDSKYFFA